jgi:phosphohistidine phosphatase
MMKKVLLCRHAKSSWEQTHLSDWQRPLNARGKRDLALMAEKWSSQETLPKVVYYSSAQRTKETTLGLVEHWKSEVVCHPLDLLYMASAETLREFIQELSDAQPFVMIVGHNPGLTDFYNCHTFLKIDNAPTASFGLISSPKDTWREASKTKWNIERFLSPKLI